MDSLVQSFWEIKRQDKSFEFDFGMNSEHGVISVGESHKRTSGIYEPGERFL